MEDLLRICIICGSKMMNVKCKLICTNKLCNYYLSCSDFL